MRTSKTFLGFWVYLMTDLTMFAGLFAAFAVLRANTFGGPTSRDIIDLPFVFTDTCILLFSSFTAGLAVLFASAKKMSGVVVSLCITFLLGASFVGMELSEFSRLFANGYSFHRSAFLSSYFALVGTHGLHITVGLLWMAILFCFLIKRGLTESNVRKLTLLSIFWHFLDIVWIFIFTIVYLMGVIL